MKKLILPFIIGTATWIGIGLAIALYSNHIKRPWHVDSQVAAGEWKIELQTPPCGNSENLQVIWPAKSGYPITVECDSMPVAEK